MTIILLALLLQAYSLPPLHPVAVSIGTVSNTITVSLRGANQDWILETNITPYNSILAFETDQARTNVTYPSIDVIGQNFDHVTVSAVGDRTLAVYLTAPTGTHIVVTGRSDDDVLYSGTVMGGAIVSRGTLLKDLFPEKHYGQLVWMAQQPHEMRLITHNGRPTAAQLRGQ